MLIAILTSVKTLKSMWLRWTWSASYYGSINTTLLVTKNCCTVQRLYWLEMYTKAAVSRDFHFWFRDPPSTHGHLIDTVKLLLIGLLRMESAKCASQRNEISLYGQSLRIWSPNVGPTFQAVQIRPLRVWPTSQNLMSQYSPYPQDLISQCEQDL